MFKYLTQRIQPRNKNNPKIISKQMTKEKQLKNKA